MLLLLLLLSPPSRAHPRGGNSCPTPPHPFSEIPRYTVSVACSPHAPDTALCTLSTSEKTFKGFLVIPANNHTVLGTSDRALQTGGASCATNTPKRSASFTVSGYPASSACGSSRPGSSAHRGGSARSIPVRTRNATFHVVGAGPGGLMAALRLSSLGHAVSLYERGPPSPGFYTCTPLPPPPTTAQTAARASLMHTPSPRQGQLRPAGLHGRRHAEHQRRHLLARVARGPGRVDRHPLPLPGWRRRSRPRASSATVS